MGSGLPPADRPDRFVPTQPPPDDACAIVFETTPLLPCIVLRVAYGRAYHVCMPVSQPPFFFICAMQVMPRGLSACIVDICREMHPDPLAHSCLLGVVASRSRSPAYRRGSR